MEIDKLENEQRHVQEYNNEIHRENLVENAAGLRIERLLEKFPGFVYVDRGEDQLLEAVAVSFFLSMLTEASYRNPVT